MKKAQADQRKAKEKQSLGQHREAEKRHQSREKLEEKHRKAEKSSGFFLFTRREGLILINARAACKQILETT